ncbi:hypothetical protein [Actinacidiphila soli]|uniref:hypothetical protein n=1 Tax=Actinacidiphila soli TaxID=2487275 RepID=UPI000FCA99CD|nr:hypothetical protein [Actinacidiphila soli]
MTTQESDDHALMTRLGVTEDDFNEAMGPVGEQIRLMAQDQGRDVEEFFLSPDDELFGTLAVGYLDAQRAGHTGTELTRTAARRTAYALERVDPADLIPLAATLADAPSPEGKPG